MSLLYTMPLYCQGHVPAFRLQKAATDLSISSVAAFCSIFLLSPTGKGKQDHGKEDQFLFDCTHSAHAYSSIPRCFL